MWTQSEAARRHRHPKCETTGGAHLPVSSAEAIAGDRRGSQRHHLWGIISGRVGLRVPLPAGFPLAFNVYWARGMAGS